MGTKPRGGGKLDPQDRSAINNMGAEKGFLWAVASPFTIVPKAVAEAKELQRFTKHLGEDVALKGAELVRKALYEAKLTALLLLNIALLLLNITNSDKYKARRISLSCLRQVRDNGLHLFPAVDERARLATTLSQDKK